VEKLTVAKMRSKVVSKLEVGPASPRVQAKMFVSAGDNEGLDEPVLTSARTMPDLAPARVAPIGRDDARRSRRLLVSGRRAACFGAD